jgi:hypothetical protein
MAVAARAERGRRGLAGGHWACAGTALGDRSGRSSGAAEGLILPREAPPLFSFLQHVRRSSGRVETYSPLADMQRAFGNR